MRKLLWATLLVLFCAGHLAAAESSRKPDDFRGLKWGLKMQALPGQFVRSHSEKSSVFYRLDGDKMSIGEAKLKKIQYIFIDDRLEGVFIEVYAGENNTRSITDTLHLAYGEPDVQKDAYEAWRFGGLNVLFEKPAKSRKEALVRYTTATYERVYRKDNPNEAPKDGLLDL